MRSCDLACCLQHYSLFLILHIYKSVYVSMVTQWQWYKYLNTFLTNEKKNCFKYTWFHWVTTINFWTLSILLVQYFYCKFPNGQKGRPMFSAYGLQSSSSLASTRVWPLVLLYLKFLTWWWESYFSPMPGNAFTVC